MNYYTEGRRISIFHEEELRDFLQKQMLRLQSAVDKEPEDYILNVNEDKYIRYLADTYGIEPLEMYPNEVSVEPLEKEIPADRFPRSFDVRRGGTYTRPVLKYYLPFQGDQALLHCCPSSRKLWTTEVSVEDGCVCFEIVDFYGDPEKIRRAADRNITKIMRQLANVQKEVDSFNDTLERRARNIFRARKEQLLKKNDLVAQLGVPVRQKQDVSGTFAVPSPKVREKIKIKKPTVSETGYQPEPTLDNSTYGSILKVIHDVGRQFERMPSTYAGKEEEDLRDHILLFLEPNFEGSATGETFNKSGKTDILLRHQGANVFIAECKFWTGAKGFLKTIDQLLGYLTWRDSKAAVVLFVDRKDFSAVVSQIKEVAADHPNYIKFSGRKDETWFNFRFHLIDDENREVRLAVMLYHIPT